MAAFPPNEPFFTQSMAGDQSEDSPWHQLDSMFLTAWDSDCAAFYPNVWQLIPPQQAPGALPTLVADRGQLRVSDIFPTHGPLHLTLAGRSKRYIGKTITRRPDKPIILDFALNLPQEEDQFKQIHLQLKACEEEEAPSALRIYNTPLRTYCEKTLQGCVEEYMGQALRWDDSNIFDWRRNPREGCFKGLRLRVQNYGLFTLTITCGCARALELAIHITREPATTPGERSSEHMEAENPRIPMNFRSRLEAIAKSASEARTVPLKPKYDLQDEITFDIRQICDGNGIPLDDVEVGREIANSHELPPEAIKWSEIIPLYTPQFMKVVPGKLEATNVNVKLGTEFTTTCPNDVKFRLVFRRLSTNDEFAKSTNFYVCQDDEDRARQLNILYVHGAPKRLRTRGRALHSEAALHPAELIEAQRTIFWDNCEQMRVPFVVLICKERSSCNDESQSVCVDEKTQIALALLEKNDLDGALAVVNTSLQALASSPGDVITWSLLLSTMGHICTADKDFLFAAALHLQASASCIYLEDDPYNAANYLANAAWALLDYASHTKMEDELRKVSVEAACWCSLQALDLSLSQRYGEGVVKHATTLVRAISVQSTAGTQQISTYIKLCQIVEKSSPRASIQLYLEIAEELIGQLRLEESRPWLDLVIRESEKVLSLQASNDVEPVVPTINLARVHRSLNAMRFDLKEMLTRACFFKRLVTVWLWRNDFTTTPQSSADESDNQSFWSLIAGLAQSISALRNEEVVSFFDFLSETLSQWLLEGVERHCESAFWIKRCCDLCLTMSFVMQAAVERIQQSGDAARAEEFRKLTSKLKESITLLRTSILRPFIPHTEVALCHVHFCSFCVSFVLDKANGVLGEIQDRCVFLRSFYGLKRYFFTFLLNNMSGIDDHQFNDMLVGPMVGAAELCSIESPSGGPCFVQLERIYGLRMLLIHVHRHRDPGFRDMVIQLFSANDSIQHPLSLAEGPVSNDTSRLFQDENLALQTLKDRVRACEWSDYSESLVFLRVLCSSPEHLLFAIWASPDKIESDPKALASTSQKLDDEQKQNIAKLLDIEMGVEDMKNIPRAVQEFTSFCSSTVALGNDSCNGIRESARLQFDLYSGCFFSSYSLSIRSTYHLNLIRTEFIVPLSNADGLQMGLCEKTTRYDTYYGRGVGDFMHSISIRSYLEDDPHNVQLSLYNNGEETKLPSMPFNMNETSDLCIKFTLTGDGSLQLFAAVRSEGTVQIPYMLWWSLDWTGNKGKEWAVALTRFDGPLDVIVKVDQLPEESWADTLNWEAWSHFAEKWLPLKDCAFVAGQDGNFADGVMSTPYSRKLRFYEIMMSRMMLLPALTDGAPDLLKQTQNGDMKTLVFMLDQCLIDVPVSALRDPELGAPLLAFCNVTTVPSLIVFLSLARSVKEGRQKNLRSITDESALVAGVAEPPACTRLATLPSVNKEVSAVAQLLRTMPVVQASKSTLCSKLPLASAFHFCGHFLRTEADSDKKRFQVVSLVCADEEEDAKASNFFRSEDLPEVPRLRVACLMGCETFEEGERFGHKRYADGIVGLPAAFLRAGVPCVVATHWAIRDEVAAVFSCAFWRYVADELDREVVPEVLVLLRAFRHAVLHVKAQYPLRQDWTTFALVGF